MRTDTIAAIATAMSSSGIGIIRISGEDAVTITEKIFRMKNGKKLSEMPTHTNRTTGRTYYQSFFQ